MRTNGSWFVALQIRNSKHEIRNKFQIRMFEKGSSLIGISNFVLRICFGFRISDIRVFLPWLLTDRTIEFLVGQMINLEFDIDGIAHPVLAGLLVSQETLGLGAFGRTRRNHSPNNVVMLPIAGRNEDLVRITVFLQVRLEVINSFRRSLQCVAGVSIGHPDVDNRLLIRVEVGAASGGYRQRQSRHEKRFPEFPRGREGILRQIRVTPWLHGFAHQPFVITSPFVTQKIKIRCTSPGRRDCLTLLRIMDCES